MTVTVRLIIEGRVQGVGYRAWCMKTARGLGLSGWVRNLTDGAVEALAQGPAAAVDQLVAACQAGPSAARVTAVNTEHLDAEKNLPAGFQQLATAERC